MSRCQTTASASGWRRRSALPSPGLQTLGAGGSVPGAAAEPKASGEQVGDCAVGPFKGGEPAPGRAAAQWRFRVPPRPSLKQSFA